MIEQAPTAIPDLPGWRRLAFGAVGSTNTEALNLAQAGDPGNVWVTGTQQLAGKARRGRSWVSEPGNLYASLLLIDPAERETLGSLPLVVSLALHRTLISVFPDAADRLAIKWPNDVLLDGKKLSGILLEAAAISDNRLAVVIGCGINCAHFPDNPLYPATSLLASQLLIEPEDLFLVFARAMGDALEEWNRGQGIATIRRDWLSAAKGIGQPLTARFETHEVSGIFKGLDKQGALILRAGDGAEHRIIAADIFFGADEAIGHKAS